MTKIYVLTNGDYSDYHIIGCYLSEELGKKAEKMYGGMLEEFNADEIGKDDRFPFIVHINPNRTTASIISSNLNEPNKKVIGHYQNIRNGIPLRTFWVEVMAENKEQAIKIASEKIMQYKVENNL